MSSPSSQRSKRDSARAHRPFDNILNFRDVGALVHRSCGEEIIKEELLFRSARPDDASQRDRLRLVEEHNIKTIIDLRSKTEHINQAKKRDAAVATSEVVPQSESQTAESLRIPGIEYAYISLNGKGFERALVRKLGWTSFGKLVGYMALGYRNDAISIMSRDVMVPRGLVGLGIDTLDSAHGEIKQIFDVLCTPSSWPILIHCTQGKDRTGAIILLLLLLMRVPEDVMTKDYMRSEVELLPELDERMKEITEIGLTEEFAGCPKEFVPRMVEHIDQRYGGVEGYLTTTGVTKEQLKSLREILQG